MFEVGFIYKKKSTILYLGESTKEQNVDINARRAGTCSSIRPMLACSSIMMDTTRLSTFVCNIMLLAAHTMAYCAEPRPSLALCSVEVQKLGAKDEIVCASSVVGMPRPSVISSAPSDVLIVICRASGTNVKNLVSAACSPSDISLPRGFEV